LDRILLWLFFLILLLMMLVIGSIFIIKVIITASMMMGHISSHFMFILVWLRAFDLNIFTILLIIILAILKLVRGILFL
jgi:hypothetical protein